MIWWHNTDWSEVAADTIISRTKRINSQIMVDSDLLYLQKKGKRRRLSTIFACDFRHVKDTGLSPISVTRLVSFPHEVSLAMTTLPRTNSDIGQDISVFGVLYVYEELNKC